MSLCAPFPGTLSVLVMDNSRIHVSPFSAYVALLRNQRLPRDFDHELFTHHPSEQLRMEALAE